MFELKNKAQRILENNELLNIILFASAGSISLFGTSAYNFAISLHVLKLTNSGLNFAITLILGALSTIIITPIAGVFADKFNKRLISISTDILNFLLLLFLYLLITKGCTLSLSMIYISTFMINIFSSIYGICIEAAKPNLVTNDKLLIINSIDKVINSFSSILGPMAGGILFAIFDIKYFIIINGVSFLISSVLQMFINFNLNYAKTINPKLSVNLFADFKEGMFYLKERRDVYILIKIFGTLNFFIGLSINIPLPYIINNVLQLKANFLGIVQAASSIGMILGAIVLRKLMKKLSFMKIVETSNFLLSICMIAIGCSVMLYPNFINQIILLIYFIIIMILVGLAISIIDISVFYFLQQTIPDEFRGRVLSIGVSISKILLPIALIISGTLINLTPSYFLPIIGGIFIFISTLIINYKPKD